MSFGFDGQLARSKKTWTVETKTGTYRPLFELAHAMDPKLAKVAVQADITS